MDYFENIDVELWKNMDDYHAEDGSLCLRKFNNIIWYFSSVALLNSITLITIRKTKTNEKLCHMFIMLCHQPEILFFMSDNDQQATTS